MREGAVLTISANSVGRPVAADHHLIGFREIGSLEVPLAELVLRVGECALVPALTTIIAEEVSSPLVDDPLQHLKSYTNDEGICLTSKYEMAA